MEQNYIILHQDKLEYFKRMQGISFAIESIEDHQGNLKKLNFKYNEHAVGTLLNEAFTYGALYGIDILANTLSVDDAQRQVTFNQ